MPRLPATIESPLICSSSDELLKKLIVSVEELK